MCDYWKRFFELQSNYIRLPQTTYGFYTSLEPIEGAIETFNWLNNNFDVWILTRPSYQNPLCYTEKRVWAENYLGIEVAKKLIICWDKGLLKGDYLIDDTINVESKLDLQTKFEGEFLHFGSDKFPNWKSVKKYFEEIYF
jgi:5'(3')-deoxyribonucleotidase